MIEDDSLKLIESGAIVNCLIRRHGNGKLRPAAGTADFEAYQQWLHYAEGSAMLPLLLKMYTARLGEGAHRAARDDRGRHRACSGRVRAIGGARDRSRLRRHRTARGQWLPDLAVPEPQRQVPR